MYLPYVFDINFVLRYVGSQHVETAVRAKNIANFSVKSWRVG